MNGIPWQYLGAGAIGVTALIAVLAFLLRWKKNSNSRQLCINSPKANEILTNNAMTAKSLERIEQHLDKVKEKSIEQTGLIKQMVELQKSSHETLKEIAINKKRE